MVGDSVVNTFVGASVGPLVVGDAVECKLGDLVGEPVNVCTGDNVGLRLEVGCAVGFAVNC
jgi:hypothetical protein